MKVERLDDLPETDECLVYTHKIITVDGLRYRAHRVAWQLVNGESPIYLLQRCNTENCVNPRHYWKSNTPYGKRKFCRNGHRYTAADRTLIGNRCHVCYQNKLAKQRRGGNPYWVAESRRKFCPQGHEYAGDNLYLEVTKDGRTKRHCRTCVIERALARRV